MADFGVAIQVLKERAVCHSVPWPYANAESKATARDLNRAAAVLEAVGKASAAGALDTAVLALAVYPHSAAYDYIRALRDAVEGK